LRKDNWKKKNIYAKLVLLAANLPKLTWWQISSTVCIAQFLSGYAKIMYLAPKPCSYKVWTRILSPKPISILYMSKLQDCTYIQISVKHQRLWNDSEVLLCLKPQPIKIMTRESKNSKTINEYDRQK